MQIEPKVLALIIRCHGVIIVYPTHPDDAAVIEAAKASAEPKASIDLKASAEPKASDDPNASADPKAQAADIDVKSLEREIYLRRLHLLNFRHEYNIENMTVIGLAKIGKTCIGKSDIFQLVKASGTHYNDQDGRRKTVEEKINEVFINARPPTKIQPVKNRICGYGEKDCVLENIELKKIDLRSHCIQKYYTKYDDFSGVFTLFSSGFSDEELQKLNNLLRKLNENIRGTKDVAPLHIFRSDILSQLTEFNISKLYFCDFTCNVYDSSDGKHSLSLEEIDKLTEYVVFENLRGGKKKKRKSIMRRKSMRSKKTLKK